MIWIKPFLLTSQVAGKTYSSPVPWTKEKRDGGQLDYRERVQGPCSLMPLTRHCNLVHSLCHAQLFVTPWTLCSMPVFPVLHCVLQFAQTHFHWVNDAIQSSHSLSPPSPSSVFPSIRIFSSESALCIRWPKYWSFIFGISPSNEYSGLISCR